MTARDAFIAEVASPLMIVAGFAWSELKVEVEATAAAPQMGRDGI